MKEMKESKKSELSFEDPDKLFKAYIENDEAREEFKSYSISPELFFNDFYSIEKLSREKRLFFFLALIYDLRVSTAQVNTYYEVFPDDASWLAKYAYKQGPFDSMSYRILTASHAYFVDHRLIEVDEAIKLLGDNIHDKFYGMAERRQKAPDCLMSSNWEEVMYNSQIPPAVIKPIIAETNKALEIASHQSNVRLNLRVCFEGLFDGLSPHQRKDVLLGLIAKFQNHVVFQEVFNTYWTEFSVRETEREHVTRVTRDEEEVEAINSKIKTEKSLSDEETKCNDLHLALLRGTRSMPLPHSVLFSTEQSLEAYARPSRSPLFSSVLDKVIFEALKRLGQEVLDEYEIIKIIEFWKKNRSPVFSPLIHDVLKKYPSISVPILLQELEGTSSDKYILAQLYRIELGKINIDNHTIQYLGRLFELSGLDSTVQYARRIDSAGRLGFFSEEGVLQQVSTPIDLSGSDTDNLAMATAELTLDLLFDFNGRETDSEIKEKIAILDKLKNSYEDLIAKKLRSFGFNNLPLKLQAWLLYFESSLKNTDLEGDVVEDYVSRYGVQGLRFLQSLDSVTASDLLKKLSVYPREVADNVLDKITEVHFLITTLNVEADTMRFVLKDFVDRLTDLISHVHEDVLSRFKSFNSCVVVLINLIKYQGLDSSKILSHCKLSQSVAGEGLSLEDVSRMKQIYRTNLQNVGARDVILNNFDQKIRSSETRVWVLRWDEQVESFIAFTHRGENIFEATSFNVDPVARGYKLGEAMLEEAIAKEAEDHILMGECYAQLPISAKYIETGWIAEGAFSEPGKEPGTEDHLLNISRDDSYNHNYWGKQTPTDVIVKGGGNKPDSVQVAFADSQLELPLRLLEGNVVLTRMFYNKETKKYVGVFELDERPRKTKNHVNFLRQKQLKEAEAEVT